jgi:dephospho-CoA kinase
MLTVALTGNIAAGKSTVAELFRSWGATIIDADQLAREAQAPGSPVLGAIAARFGREMILPDGSLDRARLRRAALADPEARQALNAIVHPEVGRRRAELLRAAQARGDRIVVDDVPLLFEALDPGAFDAVVLVDAPEPLRLERLRQERSLSEAEARQMMAAQLPAAVKRSWRGGRPPRGPHIIENDGDRATLERRARAVWEELLRLPGAG